MRVTPASFAETEPAERQATLQPAAALGQATPVKLRLGEATATGWKGAKTLI